MKRLIIPSLFSAIVLGACTGPMVTTIQVRVAHLSPDAPAVDFCVQEKSATTFTGPVLKGLGVTAGLSFGNVTKRVELPAGEYTVRLVAPNAADCATSLAGLPNYTLPKLDAGTEAVAAAVGLVGGTGTQGFTVTPYVDDPAAPAAGKIKLRIIHASPDTPAVDVGTGSGANFKALTTSLGFKNFPTSGSFDAKGYASIDPLNAATISARANGTETDALVTTGVTAPAGSIVTAWAIGQLAGTGDKRLSILYCFDNKRDTTPLTECRRLPDAN
jgi:hypothetical protein